MTDIFGDIIDVDTVEGYLRDTLQLWIPSHLAHQERRRDLDSGILPAPRSWPTISGFDLEAHEQMPAIAIVSPGSLPPVHDRGIYSTTWRFQVAVAVAGKDETEARLLASLYLAAVKGVVIQNRTLGETVEKCMWVGPDDHALIETERGEQRAIYATEFEATVRPSANAYLGPVTPPNDPYDPLDPQDTFTDAEVDVISEKLEDML